MEVENTGSRLGDEVVQLYVRDVECAVVRPTKELRGFQRIRLNPGQKQAVTFELSARQLAFYDEKTHGFVAEPGAFEIMLGSSSEDIRLRERFELTSAGSWPQ